MSTTRTVTVMFTDLVDSTATASQLDAAGADRLRNSHFSLLRAAIMGHRGCEVKNLGDGLMVVFDSAVAALSAAEEIQRAVQLQNRTRDDPPLAVRIGLSLGEVVEDDGDFFGDAVVEAARLCALADGGQVLATALLALTAGRRASQKLHPLDPVALKGVAEPVDIVEVGWTAPAPTEAGEGHVPLPARCLSAPDVALVGRQREFDDLTMSMKQVRTGNRQLVLLGGEPGIGKTTVACAFARQAYDEGAIVLFGRADEDLRLPYQPWVEALKHLLDHVPIEVASVVEKHRGSLARILPIVSPVDTNGRDDADAESARYVLYEAVRDVVAAAATSAPVVIVIDDIQWADAPSLALLRHLVSASDSQRLMVVATFRESDVTADHPLADLLAWLHRESGITRLSLGGLDDAELLTLMEAAAGQNMDADGLSLRDALLTETDGNPFFVTELLRHLVETQAIYQEGDRWVASVDLSTSGLPVSVSEVLGRRVSRLGPEASETLGAAAVIGPEFDLATLAAATSASEDTLLNVVEAACEARLVTELGPERYRFAHALVEHSLYASLTPTRRARLHRRVAELIEADDHQRQDRVGELANHWAKATAPADAAKAVEYATLAGERALDRLAPDEALRWYGQARELLDQQPRDVPRTRARIMVGIGDAERQIGLPTYRRTLLDAAHLAREVGDDELLVRAALCNYRGFTSDVAAFDTERIETLDAALAAVGGVDTPARARLLALRAGERIYFADATDLYADVRAALGIARRIGDPGIIAYVIEASMLAISTPDRLDERLRLCDEALAAALATEDPIAHFWAWNLKQYTVVQIGDMATAEECGRQRDAIANRLGQPTLQWVAGYITAAIAAMMGNLDESVELAEVAVKIGRTTGQPDVELFHLAQIGHVRMMQGRGDEPIETWRLAAEAAPHLTAIKSTIARAYCDLGRLDEARAVLEGMFPDGVVAYHMDMLWLQAATLTARVLHQLHWQQAAASLYEQLLPFDGQIDFTAVQSAGAVSEALGQLAMTLNDAEATKAHFAAAFETYERIGAAYFLARAHVEFGQWLATLPGEDDQAAGRRHIETGLATARARGYRLIETYAQG